MTVLIVEDSLTIRSLITGILEANGIDSVCFESGEAACEYVKADQPMPAVVVLDIGLPGIDGYETARILKDQAVDIHLPIIFLTGERDEGVLGKCLSIGDDYISKPFTAEVLYSKVEVHRRVSRLYRSLSNQFLDLKNLQRRISQEHDIVETIFTNQFDKHISPSQNFHFHISPKSVFNGDVLLAAHGPSGNLYVAVGDVTGHGLPAAVGALPVYQTFRTMAEKGMGVGIIAAEMNRSLRSILPDNMMLAASLVEISSQGDTITVWTGGMPPMVLADKQGNLLQLIEPQHCPLAMLEDYEFSQNVQVFNVREDDRIYLYTDGLEESRNAAGEMFGEERIYQLFNGQQPDMFSHLLETLQSFVGGNEQDDDITLVELRCVPNEYNGDSKGRDTSVRALPWSLNFNLELEDIRSGNPVPQIIRLLSNAIGFDVHQDYVSTVLSEIYSNSLDHGLLQLDSAIKNTDEGFIEFYRLRQQRLEQLEQGFINIAINFSRQDSHFQVEIVVKDSGKGFNYHSIKPMSGEESFGRGVDLLHELCDSVEYSEGGSCIRVAYTIGG